MDRAVKIELTRWNFCVCADRKNRADFYGSDVCVDKTGKLELIWRFWWVWAGHDAVQICYMCGLNKTGQDAVQLYMLHVRTGQDRTGRSAAIPTCYMCGLDRTGRTAAMLQYIGRLRAEQTKKLGWI